MQVLRTPDERFANLAGYDFAPHYVEVSYQNTLLRIHYLDEGPREAAPVLLMHGEPSWCYLYRKMIPILVAAGHRVIAPDLIGFGRSDKLAAREDYSYQFHVDTMTAFVESLDLNNITFFVRIGVD
jgi:haloalkane dehalogenase